MIEEVKMQGSYREKQKGYKGIMILSHLGCIGFSSYIYLYGVIWV